MSYTTLVIAANWYGPFISIEKASKEASVAGLSQGLYLAVNKRNQAYVGISNDIVIRLGPQHHVLGTLSDGDADIWLGAIASQSIPGRRTAEARSHPLPIVIAEWALAYYLELSENYNLRKSRPVDSFILINRWFDRNAPYTRQTGRGHQNWPDLIEYDSELGAAQIVWYGGDHKILDNAQIDTLRLP